MSQHIIAGAEVGKGPLVQRLRLWSGLVLFGYVLFHYLNHSLGHLSVDAMEYLLDWQEPLIDNPLGLAVLYGALLVHGGLGLWRLLHLRTWRRPAWVWAQIVLGLSIPWLLASHITYTRGAQQLLGIGVDYQHELLLLWPGAAFKQSLLLLIVWLHGCLGIHFWLRLRPWYSATFPALVGLAALIPAMALTGWISAARRLLERLQLEAVQTEQGRRVLDELVSSNSFIVDNLRPLEYAGQSTIAATIALVVVIMVARWYTQRFGDRVRVTYYNGTTVTSTPGHTLLEISQASGIPHMSVCGGRARCSTCRTVILAGNDHLTPPTDAEIKLLKKFDAGEEIRLACQCRVSGDVTVRPMIQAKSGGLMPRRADPLGWGMEREVAVMFADVRGFSRISENALPYDVVFILNSLFDEVGGAIENANGYIDKFMGDGIMALFGLASQPNRACRDSLRAALDSHEAAARASKALSQQLGEPMRIGIGIHTGQAVIGRVGKTSDQTSLSRLTAIGETVNVASRLETATKEFGCGLVVSARLAELAGIEIGDEIGIRKTIQVRNISEPVDIIAVHDLEKLRALLTQEDPIKPAPPEETNVPVEQSGRSDGEGAGAAKPGAKAGKSGKAAARRTPAKPRNAPRGRRKKKTDE